MAAGASDRQPQQAGAHDVERVVHDGVIVLLDQPDVLVGQVARGAKVAGGHERLAHGGSQPRGAAPVVQLVAGQLLDDEAVVGLVVVQGRDHPIAIAPLAVGQQDVRGVDIEADRVDVARQVEPVAPPALAEVGRGEQAIDQPFVSVGRRVGKEGGLLVRRRRQAHEVEIDPTQQRRAVGFGRIGQPGGFEPLEQEGVERVSHRAGLARHRHARTIEGPERPELAVARRDGRLGRIAGPRCRGAQRG